MATTPRRMAAEEFGRRLRDHLGQPDCRVVWFLGAGCSISSGIPGAAALVDEWLPRLKRYVQGDDEAWQDWARTQFEKYDMNPALVYGDVIEALFPNARDRQQEVERLTVGKEPGIGYALLALLMAHTDHGARTNVVLTTNFDDLVADALYLLTQRKPLVVAHENLARFVWQSETRPLVVKLHGDAMLAPRNTTAETAEIDRALRARVLPLLQRCMLVFCGYGGNDESIARMIDEADEDAFPLGIYWIGRQFPTGPVTAALERRPVVVHVEQRDFDAFLISIAEHVGVELPGFDRWASLFRRYDEALGKKVAEAEPGPGRDSVSRLRVQFQARTRAWEAHRLRESDPVRAMQMFEEAVAVAPHDAEVLRSFAIFLDDVWKDPDRAEELFQRAVKEDPNNATVLGDYAVFLKNVRKEADRTEEFYRRAIDADPNHANNLGNYANFLMEVRKDFVLAEEFYRRAIEAGPNHANVLGNYANFLMEVQHDVRRAEEFYRRAIEADPNHANVLGNYATFLMTTRKDVDRAEEFYRRAIDAGPNHAINLGNYAIFLMAARKDFSRAEEFHRRAIDADPNNANILGNFAQFLFARGDDVEAIRLCDEALSDAAPEPPLRLEIGFYQYAHVPERAAAALVDIRRLLTNGVRSEAWDFAVNLERARREQDPRLRFLTALSDVIADRSPVSILDAFAEWTVE